MRGEGGWNLLFAAGIIVGGFLAGYVFANPSPIAIAPETEAALRQLGVSDFSGLVPDDLFSWSALVDPRRAALIILGGFCVGFGMAYAGGCTSGHGLAGVADLQPASLVALVAFFGGGVRVAGQRRAGHRGSSAVGGGRHVGIRIPSPVPPALIGRSSIDESYKPSRVLML